MRVLIATGLYPPEIGGPATYTKLLEERLPQKGFEVSVLPFRTVRHLPPLIRHIAYGWKLASMARHADIILVQDTVSTGFPAAIAAFILRKPLIVRVPGDYAWEQGTQRWGVKEPLEEFQNRLYGWQISVLRWIQRLVVRRAARIIAPSEYLAKIIFGWLSETKQINVIYNGVVISDASQSEREENLIVSSGRLVSWKGFDALIDIVAKHADWRLTILGDGPEKDLLARKIKDAGAAERITLAGQVSHTEAQRWFKRASVFVLNSGYEGLSHTLIEAMAAGSPVIATRIGGNPEVVRDGIDGVLIPARDEAALEKALREMLSDTNLRAKYSGLAAKRAHEFSIEKTVAKTAELLHAST